MLKVTGLDDFQRKLDDLARRAKSLSGAQSVPVPELLTPDFLHRCSRFHSANEMFEASGFKIDLLKISRPYRMLNGTNLSAPIRRSRPGKRCLPKPVANGQRDS